MMENKNYTLLPKGRFVLTDEDGKEKKGRFSLEVLEQFCINQGITSYLNLLSHIESGMSIKQYGLLIDMAVNGIDKASYKRGLDMIENTFDGALADPGMLDLILHCVGRLSRLPEAPQMGEDAESESEKKSD